MSDWNPNEYTCPHCKDVIRSSYPGEFVTCKCGDMSVDQTEHYTRFIGLLPMEDGDLDRNNA